ncbi:MAG: UDP-N-acetylmuramoyl-tripeptide--D-alanyl-D-alanine ligase [Chitinophagales bacterium]
MNIPELYEIYKRHPSVQTDTRKLKEGDIFFALKGPNFNANEFAKKAIDEGASYAIIDEKKYEIAERTILVDDVLIALQQLAKYHRAQFNNLSRNGGTPFIGITGSNGKTTTKELIHAVLSTSYQTYTTEGNLNNQIGIPLTLLKIKNDAEVAILEMGANHIGEIASYCQIAMPTHGLITNCGKAHLEGFGSEEGVRKAKGELFDYLRTLTDGYAFVMWDYDYLQQMSKGIPAIVKYGTKEDAQIIGKVLKNDPLLEVEMIRGFDEKKITTQLVGAYNLPNVLAAVAVGKFFRVPETKIRSAIESYVPSNSRSQLIQLETNKIILDAYNANPSSMKLAIENFSKMPDDKILILGSMAELGKESEREHAVLVEQIKNHKWKYVVLVGNEFQKTNHPFLQFKDSIEVRDWFHQQKFDHTNIFIKGSRSMQMERTIET